MNASESVLRWFVRPLVRLRTYANRPLASGMKYLNSPSTLSAPPAPAWPARTEARAVLEVLLATAVLLGETNRVTTAKKAATTLHDGRTPVPPEHVRALNRVCHCGRFRQADIADSLAHHPHYSASWDTINP